jgi:Major Facilitator Superfamily
MRVPRGLRRADDDRFAALGAVSAYSLGLGIATITIPLVALDAGYDAAAVGFLVAIAAGCQFLTRLALPRLLGRFADRTLITWACLGIGVAFLLLMVTTALPAFIVAQVLQGATRAMFWTSSQTHAVRGAGRPVQRLVDMNVAANAGTLSGPALGGMLAVAGLPVALAAAGAAAVVGAVASRGMRALPPFDRRRAAGTGQLLRRDGVDVACWAAAVSGGWWSMSGSYIPVLGLAAGLDSVGIGWMITISEGSGLAALVGLRRLPQDRVRIVVRIAAATVACALIALALVALTATVAVTVLFALVMVIGGASSGTLTTLAPAMASLAARPEEQADALALTGTFRAGALLVAPALVGTLLTVAGVPAAVIVVAAALGLPGVAVGRRRLVPGAEVPP